MDGSLVKKLVRVLAHRQHGSAVRDKRAVEVGAVDPVAGSAVQFEKILPRRAVTAGAGRVRSRRNLIVKRGRTGAHDQKMIMSDHGKLGSSAGKARRIEEPAAVGVELCGETAALS